MQTVFIEYIGKQKQRTDNIRNSGRVWAGPNTWIEMPIVERYSYLQHPTMFREISREEIAARSAAKAVASEGLDQIKSAAEKLSDAQIEEMIDSLKAELTARAEARLALQAVTKIEVAGEEPSAIDVALSDNPETAAAYHARIRKIVDALREMDPKDRDQYTLQGKPRVDFVSDMIGFKVTAEEIQEARNVMG